MLLVSVNNSRDCEVINLCERLVYEVKSRYYAKFEDGSIHNVGECTI